MPVTHGNHAPAPSARARPCAERASRRLPLASVGIAPSDQSCGWISTHTVEVLGL